MGSESPSGNKVVRLPKGTVLFHQGEPSRDLFILKQGKVRVYKTEGGVDIDLDEAGAGAVVGEVAAIDGGVRSGSVVAVEDTVALLVPVGEFRRIADRLPDWFKKITTILVQRLREADDKIEYSKGGDKRMHVAALIALLTYTDRCSTVEAGWVFGETALENEIVDVLDIPLSEASAALAQLEKENLLHIEKAKVVIRDRDKLDEYSRALFRESGEGPVT